MSIYSDALAALQRAGAHGGDLTHTEKRNLLAVVRASAAGGDLAGISDAAVQQSKTDTTTFGVDATTNAGLVDVQFDILDAFDAMSNIADVIAAIATASSVLRASAVLVNGDGVTAVLSANDASTASTAALAAAGDATLVVNDIMDGYDT